jgi:ABC-type glutathione transport system ATPase component
VNREPLLELRISAAYGAGRPVLHDAAIAIYPGEILGLAGQSGAGKSTLGLAILGLHRFRKASVTGYMRFHGRELLDLPERHWRAFRGREIAFVPQSPLASLNPVLSIGAQLTEAWRAHASGPATAWKARLRALLESVCLPPDEKFLGLYPRQLSVGLAQRVLIAMALIHRPALIVADEPTSALDMITQAEILELFRRVNRERGAAILYISHDLASMASLAHRIAILERGSIVEDGPPEQVFRAPRHPYTARLVAALPRLGAALPGETDLSAAGLCALEF